MWRLTGRAGKQAESGPRAGLGRLLTLGIAQPSSRTEDTPTPDSLLGCGGHGSGAQALQHAMGSSSAVCLLMTARLLWPVGHLAPTHTPRPSHLSACRRSPGWPRAACSRVSLSSCVSLPAAWTLCASLLNTHLSRACCRQGLGHRRALPVPAPRRDILAGTESGHGKFSGVHRRFHVGREGERVRRQGLGLPPRTSG